MESVTTRGQWGWKVRLGTIVCCCFLLLLITRADAALTALLEGPEDGQTVAGVAVIRGWAFSDTVGVTITKVDLLINGTLFTSIPCCSARGDVARQFSQFPVDNTTNSGFGITANYSLLPPGRHIVTVKVTDSSGAQQDLTSAVTVVRAGDSQFLDQVDVTGAMATREGQDVVLMGARVRDKASQQATQVTARLRWFRNLQGLGLVEATTTGTATLTAEARQSRAQSAQGAEVAPIRAQIESPSNGQVVSGIAVLRGWAFSSAGRSIRTIQLLVDGNPFAVVPCCSPRDDVARDFPNVPEALNSGFGITVNYGALATGVHTIALQIEDSARATKTLYKGVLAKQPGGIAFIEQLDLSAATVRIANGALVIEGAKIAGTSRILRYRFDVSAQAFLLTEDSAAEIAITNTSCDVNGDTSSLATLKQNPGADGISLQEAMQAIYNTPTTIDVLLTWQTGGTLKCSATGGFPGLTRDRITLDGDVNGDGKLDVILDGSAIEGIFSPIYINASNVTVRHLRVLGSNSASLVVVQAEQGKVVTRVALIGIESILPPFVQNPTTINSALLLIASPRGGQSASLTDVLVSGSRGNGGRYGIAAFTNGDNGTGVGEVRRLTLIENELADSEVALILTNSSTQKALLTQAIVANNTIHNERLGIYMSGGISFDGPSTGNTTTGAISGNTISNVTDTGIIVVGAEVGQGSVTGNTADVDISGNQIAAEAAFYAGINVRGGNSSRTNNSQSVNNMVTATVAENIVQNAKGDAINVSGGFGILGPTVQNFASVGIHRNALTNAKFAAIRAAGGWSASDSMAELMIADNTINNAGGNGIEIDGGTARIQEGNNRGAADNTALGTVQGNAVQGSILSDIAVFGGFDNSAGAVTGNLAEQTIGTNNSRTPICQDGLADNIARCTFANASTEAETTTQREERAITVQPAVVPLLNQMDERMTDLRTRAQEATSAESAAELSRLAERLAERKAEIMLRRRQ